MGAKVKVKVRYPKPDIKKMNAKIHKRMTKFIIGSLKIWVLETVDPIPVWSGAARASFLFLAAKAETSIKIAPVAPDPPGSRISLGITEAEAKLIVESKSALYGWEWRSTLDHIGIVESRVGFISAGFRALRNRRVELPALETKPTRK